MTHIIICKLMTDVQNMAHASDEVLYSFFYNQSQAISIYLSVFLSFASCTVFEWKKNAFHYRRIRTVLLHDTICYQTLPLHDLFAREKTNGYTNEVFRIRGTIELKKIG